MRILLSCVLLLLYSSLIAQNVPNHSFERWDSTKGFPLISEPVDWKTSNHHTGSMPAGPGVKRNADAYSADSSAELKSQLLGFSAQPYASWLVNGEPKMDIFGAVDLSTGGTPITQKPIFVEGYYKYTSIAIADTARVYVMVKKWDTMNKVVDTLAFDSVMLVPNGSWTKFTRSINYIQSGVADSIVIGFFSSSPTNPKGGNVVLVDSVHVTLAPDTTDGGVSSFTRPLSNVGFLDTQDVEIKVKNYFASVMQSFELGLTHDGQLIADEAFVGFIDSLDSTNFIFKYQWVPTIAGANELCAYTHKLLNDVDHSNDTACLSVNVPVVTEGSLYEIAKPHNKVTRDFPAYIQIELANNGNQALSNFVIEWTIDGLKMGTDTLTNTISLLDSSSYTFSMPWVPADTGWVELCAYIKNINGDIVLANDTSCRMIYIENFVDAEIGRIVSPTMLSNANEALLVSAWIYNRGNVPLYDVDISYSISGSYSSTITMTDTLQTGDSALIAIDSTWIETDPVSKRVCVYIDGLTPDTIHANDTACRYIQIVGDYDLGVISINDPGAVNVGDSITIEIDYVNFGDLNLDFYELWAGNGLGTSVSDLIQDTIKPGDTLSHVFSTKWIVPEGLSYELCAWPDFGFDADSSNDTSCSILNIVNVPSIETFQEFEVFPNPSDGGFTLRSSSRLPNSISVYNIQGIQMGSVVLEESGRFNLPFSEGVYILSWLDEVGQTQYRRVSILH